ncbi:hypothetical protein BDZ45DRAFT_683693 [Acephala macrosclerotiorum]|nr:hypothetical protein BDZ45DRAFT_683693 [Acephala macrosclerotiorum]
MEESKAILLPSLPALEVTVVDNTSPHTHTIIVLHGFNENGVRLRNRVLASLDSDNMNLKDRFPSVRWIFPTAPIRSPGPSTLRLRAQQARWFDVPNMEKLCGVCQGAALAVMMVLCFGRTLGGCFAVCGWLPLFGDLKGWRGGDGAQGYRAKLAQIQNIADLRDTVAQDAMHTKVFLTHNKNDEVIPFWNHTVLSKLLKDLGMEEVTSAVFEDGSHWFKEPDGLDTIVGFLKMDVGVAADAPKDS